MEAALYSHPSVRHAAVVCGLILHRILSLSRCWCPWLSIEWHRFINVQVGIPDERLGECVAAVVTLHPANQSACETDIMTTVSSRLAAYKVPVVLQVESPPPPQFRQDLSDALQVWPEMPLVATGKIDKKKIRSELGLRLTKSKM